MGHDGTQDNEQSCQDEEVNLWMDPGVQDFDDVYKWMLPDTRKIKWSICPGRGQVAPSAILKSFCQ